MLDQLGGRQDPAASPDETDEASVLLRLRELGGVGTEHEREHLPVERHLRAGLLRPARAVVVAPTPPPGTPEIPPQRYGKVAPPVSPPTRETAVVSTARHDGHERRDQEDNEQHEVDDQHDHDPDLERLCEPRLGALPQADPERHVVTADHGGIEPVDEVAVLADFEMPLVVGEQVLQRRLDLGAVKASGFHHVPQGGPSVEASQGGPDPAMVFGLRTSPDFGQRDFVHGGSSIKSLITARDAHPAYSIRDGTRACSTRRPLSRPP